MKKSGRTIYIYICGEREMEGVRDSRRERLKERDIGRERDEEG